MTLTINDTEEQLAAVPIDFQCGHLQRTPSVCKKGCYKPSVRGPWICSNVDCQGHPSKYTDPCFGKKPWIFPALESQRWDVLRDEASGALPPAGEWALEIILDHYDAGDKTATELRALAQTYERRSGEAKEPIDTDVEKTVAVMYKFTRSHPPRSKAGDSDRQQRNTHVDYRHVDVDKRPDIVERLGEAYEIEYWDEQQELLALEESMKTIQQEQLAREQKVQQQQTAEDAELQEHLARIALIEEQEMQQRNAKQQEIGEAEREQIERAIRNSVRERNARQQATGILSDAAATIPKVGVSGPLSEQEVSVESVPASHDELDHVDAATEDFPPYESAHPSSTTIAS